MSRRAIAPGGPPTGAAPMKHKTWFRLVLKAIGVLLIGLTIPTLSQVVLFILYNFMVGVTPLFVPRSFGRQWITVAGPMLLFIFGLYLLFGGKWIVNLCIPSNRPYCPECGYDLSKATSANCAECGVKLPRGNSTG